uniref:Uncharacterized protein n=1 Tax=Zooxanthella nutricula TaxID=1333877 RepID=A0A7S2IYM0_9DINO
MAQHSAQSIQELQKGQITRMLSLDSQGTWDGATTFKVLVHDMFCRDVIGPLLNVGALRSQGVTTPMSLHHDRQPQPGVPAIYFVEPTEENIKRIVEDLEAGRSGLYESVYINFASSVPRHLLEQLAKGALNAGAANRVAGVFDRFVSFVSLSPHLFALNLPHAYWTLHSPATKDQYLSQYIDRIVDGLLSVLITAKALPIIRCQKSDPVAEMISRKLDERIREMKRTGGSSALELFTGARGAEAGGAGQRPLLCIFDRDVDLASMVNHTWTYQAMVQDILGMKLNKVVVPEDSGDGKEPKKTTYSVDEKDTFWVKHGGDEFPDVMKAVHEVNEKFNEKRQQMTQSSGGEDPADSAGLASAFNALPEMMEQKRLMDKHTNMIHALLEAFKGRDLKNLLEMEDNFASQSTGTSIGQVEQLLTDGQKGTVLDKTRALMALYLSKPSMPPAQLSGLIEALQNIGGDVSGIRYLQHLSSMKNMVASQSVAPAPGGAGSSGGSGAASLMNSMFSKGEGFLAAGLNSIQNVILSKKEMVICKILESLMEPTSKLDDTYHYFDPKTQAAGQEAPRTRTPFRRSLVFMIGGGNYTEMQSIQEWAQNNGRHVTYGCTDLVSPEQFVSELCTLGKDQAGGGAPDLS